MIKQLLVQVGIACAVFWPLLSYVWHGSVTLSALQATFPAVVIFAVIYAAFTILMYLRRTRAR